MIFPTFSPSVPPVARFELSAASSSFGTMKTSVSLQLIPRRINSLGKFEALEHETRARGLLNCLNADEVLMETMGRKRSWSFRTVPTLVAVAQSIPSFQLHITSLYYESYSAEFMSEATCPLPSINFGFKYLALCPNMSDPLDFRRATAMCLSILLPVPVPLSRNSNFIAMSVIPVHCEDFAASRNLLFGITDWMRRVLHDKAYYRSILRLR